MTKDFRSYIKDTKEIEPKIVRNLEIKMCRKVKKVKILRILGSNRDFGLNTQLKLKTPGKGVTCA